MLAIQEGPPGTDRRDQQRFVEQPVTYTSCLGIYSIPSKCPECGNPTTFMQDKFKKGLLFVYCRGFQGSFSVWFVTEGFVTRFCKFFRHVLVVVAKTNPRRPRWMQVESACLRDGADDSFGIFLGLLFA